MPPGSSTNPQFVAAFLAKEWPSLVLTQLVKLILIIWTLNKKIKCYLHSITLKIRFNIFMVVLVYPERYG